MTAADPTLIDHLWSSTARGEVYAVVDAARSPAIHGQHLRDHPEQRCLYDGALSPALARAAPYLVRLWPSSSLTSQLTGEAWGQSWGVFLTSSSTIDQLRRHLRRFLTVRRERGRTFHFRYYDPRVLTRYLPTCTDEELRTFFGPIQAFCAESTNGQSLVELRLRDDGGLGQRQVFRKGGRP